MKVLALDGHDAAGKTTLALRLASAVGARYVRPFGGDFGQKLMKAYKAGEHLETLSIGRQAISTQLEEARESDLLVMDRGWVTVATLVPRELFASRWQLWLPSVLLWCDETTTRGRLRARAVVENEPDDWHAHFLSEYLDRFSLRPGEVVRTDVMNEAGALERLVRLYRELESLRTVFPVGSDTV